MKKFEMVKLALFLGFAWFVLTHGRGFIENMRAKNWAKNSIKESFAASFASPVGRAKEKTQDWRSAAIEKTEETKQKVSNLSMRSEPQAKVFKITENQISKNRSAYPAQRYEENTSGRVYPDLQK